MSKICCCLGAEDTDLEDEDTSRTIQVLKNKIKEILIYSNRPF